MPKIFLVNTGKDPFLFTLYHDHVCRRAKACTCDSLQERNAAGKPTIRRLPASCQIDAGQASGLLPSEVFHVPQIKSRISEGKLQRVTEEDWAKRGLSRDAWETSKPQERLLLWRSAPVVAMKPVAVKMTTKITKATKPASSGE